MLTQSELGELVGVHQITVSHWETGGIKNIRPSHMRKLHKLSTDGVTDDNQEQQNTEQG